VLLGVGYETSMAPPQIQSLATADLSAVSRGG
jgi:hypothetical protein